MLKLRVNRVKLSRNALGFRLYALSLNHHLLNLIPKV